MCIVTECTSYIWWRNYFWTDQSMFYYPNVWHEYSPAKCPESIHLMYTSKSRWKVIWVFLLYWVVYCSFIHTVLQKCLTYFFWNTIHEGSRHTGKQGEYVYFAVLSHVSHMQHFSRESQQLKHFSVIELCVFSLNTPILSLALSESLSDARGRCICSRASHLD